MHRFISLAAVVVAWTLHAGTLVSQETVWVQQGSAMRYLVNSAAPGGASEWTAGDFDDSSWSEGVFGIGYDAGDMIGVEIDNANDDTFSAYTRSRFVVEDLEAIRKVRLGADYDDGFAAWINGVEVLRVNVPGGDLSWNTPAASNHESSNADLAEYEALTDITEIVRPLLVEGENVLAVGVWNIGPDSSDLALVPLLTLNPPDPISGTPLCGVLEGERALALEDSPYTVDCDVEILEGSTLTIEAGVEIYFSADASVAVGGQLYALGASTRPIVMTSNIGEGRWDGITIDHGDQGEARESILRHVRLSMASVLLTIADTAESPILVEDCRFDRWSGNALDWDSCDGLVVRRCEFGLDTPLSQTDSEIVHGRRGGAIVEYCTFGLRTGYNDVLDIGDADWNDPVPTVRYNTFLGGEDDAIDYDNSAGWIVGNLVMNFWPDPEGSSNPNGGGITGNDASDCVVANNVVYNCYHGIGFKNGSTPLVVNNLVLNCSVGLTFYKDDCDAPPPRPVLRNNIVWGNVNRETGADQNVLPNGRWWPIYCQEEEVQAEIDMQYSIVQGGWPGEGNVDEDPRLIDPESGDFAPGPDSPALDSGFGGPFVMEGAPADLLEEILARDRFEQPRYDLDCVDDTGAGDPPHVDRGPIEATALFCDPDATPLFLRADANDDASVDIGDVVSMLFHLYAGAPTDCADALDVDDDGVLDSSDPISLLAYLFLRGDPPRGPFPGYGFDPTGDELTCERR